MTLNLALIIKLYWLNFFHLSNVLHFDMVVPAFIQNVFQYIKIFDSRKKYYILKFIYTMYIIQYMQKKTTFFNENKICVFSYKIYSVVSSLNNENFNFFICHYGSVSLLL